MKKHAIQGPGLRFVSVLHENGMVTGTAGKYLVWGKRRQDFSATGLNSFLGRSHVNAWKEMYMMYGPIRADTGLSSSRSHVNTPLVLIPSAICNRRF